jgi:hypothetical protein
MDDATSHMLEQRGQTAVLQSDRSDHPQHVLNRIEALSVSEAIQNIVDAYVKLGNFKALEELKSHRQSLVIALDGRNGEFNFDLLLEQIRDEIDRIDCGLRKLQRPSEP